MTGTHPIAEHAPVELPTVRTHPFDPAPELALLREQRPLCRLHYPGDQLGWLVTSHALARAVLADPRFSVRVHLRAHGDTDKLAEIHEKFREQVGEGAMEAGNLLALDPPEHTPLRRLQAGYFTVRRAIERRPGIERIVASRLDAMQQTGPPVDLVETFAFPVHSLTICDLLGFPDTDLETFDRRPQVMRDREASADEAAAAAREFFDYVRSAIEQKRAQPTDDVLSDLVSTRELTDDELIGVAFMLSGTATANMLALGTFALLYDPERWETLRADPSLIEKAVEELLRYLTVFQPSPVGRTALEDVEFDGITIKAGEHVTVSLAAANRDPEKFADPDRFEPSRDASGHLALGHGRHMCIGQHLARVELQVGLTGLIQRFPTLRLAVPVDDVPLYSDEHEIYGVHHVPVRW
jgi:cytochrome P450